jgi:glycosyltransferase involved in cell wall biosynthesis
VRAAWRHRGLIPLKWRLALGPYVGGLLRMAYPATRPGTSLAPEPQLADLPGSQEAGVNLIGYLHAESGVGEAARSSLRALRHSGLPHALIDYRLGNISRMNEQLAPHTNTALYPVNLLHVNADQSKIARDHLGPALFDGRHTIGFWYWEMPVFPDFLHFAFEQVDEIWVATEFNRQAMAACTNKPVVVMPPAIEVHIERPMDRAQLGLPQDCLVFLHISDALSMHQRKNPLGVIEAFRIAFGDQPQLPVLLQLKLSNLDAQPALARRVREAIAADPRIRLTDRYLDRNELNNLIDACDCYVSLHRAEGFGLPIAEAMYLGKPVIATHWSGNVDFMGPDNTFAVAHRLVALQEDIGPYQEGQLWAEPDLQDAAAKMRAVWAHPEHAREVGQRARRSVREALSPERAAARMRQRIADITAAAAARPAPSREATCQGR